MEGLVMGTRCGDIDPAILFHLAENGYDLKTLNDLCNKKSGVLGISGCSNDMRTLVEEAGRCLVMQAMLANRPVLVILLDSWGKYTRLGDANRIKQWLEARLGTKG